MQFLVHSKKISTLDVAGATLLILAIAFCTVGLSRLQSNTEDVVQWLPDNSPARKLYDDFQKKFGSDDFLVVTWPGCTIDDPRLAHFCQRLTDDNPDKLIQSVTNGSDVIDSLRGDIDLSKEYTINRFRGIYFGAKDPQQTLAIVELTKTGTANPRLALQQVESAITETADLELSQAIFGGYPYIGIYLDKQLKNSFVFYLFPSVILASIMSLYCLRNISLSSIVFFASMVAGACSMAIVPLMGFKFGGLMSIIPALVYILTLSGSIHLIHYSLDVIGDPWKLISIGWKPCSISALTTAIGMSSLGRSVFPAIRNLGFFCATGAGFALLFQLLIVPWLLNRFGTAGQKNLAQRSKSSHQNWDGLTQKLQRGRFVFAFAGIGIMLLSAVGLSRLTARVQVEKLFAEDSPIIKSLVNLESRMGSIDQAELLISFEGAEDKDFHVRSKLVHGISRYLSSLEEIGAIHSLHNYLPREPTGTGLRTAFRRKTLQQLLDQRREQLAESPFLDLSSGMETWRISLRYPFAEEVDVERLKLLVLDSASTAIDKLMQKEAFVAIEPPTHLNFTGKNYLFHSAQKTLLGDFYRNFLLAFLIITPVLMLILRSPAIGLLAMIPNLFPIVVLFGVLGWTNWPVDIAVAMTACVALGIAVDDTTHFLMRFREFGGSMANISTPIRQTMAQCGPAMLKTTSIGGAGLLVYGFSDMLVVKNFSLAITCMLVLALLADIFILPALLFLCVRKTKAKNTHTAVNRPHMAEQVDKKVQT